MHVKDLLSRYAIDAGTVVDIGSMDVNGTCRHLFPAWRYIGVDMEPEMSTSSCISPIGTHFRAAAPIS